jgi:hypothetical protein
MKLRPNVAGMTAAALVFAVTLYCVVYVLLVKVFG